MQQTVLSTSALAKTLKINARHLFKLFHDLEWISRDDNSWQLESAGKEHGGEYRSSEQYGRYIVWPQTLLEHPLLQAAADSDYLTANQIAESFQRSGRFINRVLREMGLLRRAAKGWQLTEAGEAAGGVQKQTKAGAFYAAWPQSFISEPQLVRTLAALNRHLQRDQQEKDLFDSEDVTELAGQKAFLSLDGHALMTSAELEVCQWLYMMSIPHAYQRNLGNHPDYRCDFYLPEHGIFIEIWEGTETAREMSEHLDKKEWANSHQLTLIELSADDVDNLDEVLTRHLDELGIHVY